MAPKAVDARRRIHRNGRFTYGTENAIENGPSSGKRAPSKERKGCDVSVLRGSDPTTTHYLGGQAAAGYRSDNYSDVGGD
jgi:hypothetical protein